MVKLMGMVTDIQRFSIHDGPGIRTTVFLKGCNANCRWCHNPESINPEPELLFIEGKCVGCQKCLVVCKEGVHQFPEGKHVLQRELCTWCNECVRQCHTKALVMVGRSMTIDEVMEEIRRDTLYYKNSGGGVTLSGGEPLVQYKFTYELLKRCCAEGINTAIETSLLVDEECMQWQDMFVDIAIIDIKAFDDVIHTEWVGVSNRMVLENVHRLAKACRQVIIRTPIISGFNDNEQEIADISELIKNIPNLMYYELLSYNPLGESKYRSLGREYSLAGLKRQSVDELMFLANVARDKGIKTLIDGANIG